MRIIFFGTPLFAAKIVSRLLENKIEVCAVVTRPDKPRGRSGQPQFSPVKQVILEKFPHIPVYQPDRASSPPFIKELERCRADLFIVVAYGEIVKQELLDLPRLGCINLHTSLLPKYRGAAPIHFALLNGEEKTGVSIIEMTAKMDEGPLLAQEEILIDPNENFAQLETRLLHLGEKKLFEVIEQYETESIQKISQNEEEATYTSKVNPALAKIDWKEEARVLYNRIRAFTPRPGAWCSVFLPERKKIKRMKIIRARWGMGEGKEGETLAYREEGWKIACGKGALELLEVQLEGKKSLPIAAFIRGVQEPPKFL